LAEKALILDEKKEVMKLSPLGKFTSLIPITRSEE
jgi:hypothetical protein